MKNIGKKRRKKVCIEEEIFLWMIAIMEVVQEIAEEDIWTVLTEEEEYLELEEAAIVDMI